MLQPKSASAVTRDSAEAETHSPDDCADSLRGGGGADAGTHSSDSDSTYTNEIASQEDGRTVKKRKIGEIEKNISRFAMGSFSNMDGVMLNAIFRHFAHPYVPTMPMVGTCRKVFFTWSKKRRDLALEMVRDLALRLDAVEEAAILLGNRSIRCGSLAFYCRRFQPTLCDVIDLIR